MTKVEFINKFQENTGDEGNQWSKADCAKAIECFTLAVVTSLSNGEWYNFCVTGCKQNASG